MKLMYFVLCIATPLSFASTDSHQAITNSVGITAINTLPMNTTIDNVMISYGWDSVTGDRRKSCVEMKPNKHGKVIFRIIQHMLCFRIPLNFHMTKLWI
jgi:hypothetical protein